MIGAIVILLGLYLVVWGKNKDYDSPPSPIINEHVLPDKQTTESNAKDKEKPSNHELITISNIGAGNLAQYEQV